MTRRDARRRTGSAARTVIIAGAVSDDAAREIYSDGWESPKPYTGSCLSRA